MLLVLLNSPQKNIIYYDRSNLKFAKQPGVAFSKHG